MVTFAIMEKRDTGWFWVEYVDGVPRFVGAPTSCTHCHQGGDDFVLSFDFDSRR